MDTQHYYWIAAAAALALAIGAGWADHRRQRRARLDDIGWVPWRGIQVGAAFGLLVAVVLAFKVG